MKWRQQIKFCEDPTLADPVSPRVSEDPANLANLVPDLGESDLTSAHCTELVRWF